MLARWIHPLLCGLLLCPAQLGAQDDQPLFTETLNVDPPHISTDKSVTYDFVFRKVNAQTPVARGALTVVYVNKTPSDDRMRVTPMPETLARQIDVAPPELLESKEKDS